MNAERCEVCNLVIGDCDCLRDCTDAGLADTVADLVDWDFVAMCDRIEARHGSGGLDAHLDAIDD